MSTRKQTAEITSNGLAQLDKLLEHRSRLGVCVLLADTDAMSFASLKQLLNETDGNMGAHLRKLEDTGYVKVAKRFESRFDRSGGSLWRPSRNYSF